MDRQLVIFIVLVVLILVIYYSYFVSRSRSLLRRWARENGFILVKKEHRFFRKGPYMLTGRNQAVFRVVVRDEHGLKLTGWVRCGNWLAGIFGSEIEATMDGPSNGLGI